MTDMQALDPNMAVRDPQGAWLWYDAAPLTLEGKGWPDTAAPYERLPARAQRAVSEAVWELSRCPAGLSLRFTSDAPALAARWEAPGRMDHMPATGVSGLDLYVRHAGQWRWLAVGRVPQILNQQVLVQDLTPEPREYRLYLPLYSVLPSLALGVPPGARLAPAAPPAGRPILFYGTSITQGGCASRPGMAYPAILSRRLNWPVINLGFSGNGWLQPEVVDLLCELDPQIFVLDPLPNIAETDIALRVEPAVRRLRAAHPATPIVLVEHPEYGFEFLLAQARRMRERKNADLAEVCLRLVAEGMPGLYHVRGNRLFGNDGEAAVDGVHPTDLGFLRMADELRGVLSALLPPEPR